MSITRTLSSLPYIGNFLKLLNFNDILKTTSIYHSTTKTYLAFLNIFISYPFRSEIWHFCHPKQITHHINYSNLYKSLRKQYEKNNHPY